MTLWSYRKKAGTYLTMCAFAYCFFCVCVYVSIEKIICFTRGHIDTYLWWNRSPNYRILFFTCFTNSSRSPLWNTSKSQERLLDSLLISTLQILGNSRWCPREMAYLREHSKLYVCSLTVSNLYLTDVGVFKY